MTATLSAESVSAPGDLVDSDQAPNAPQRSSLVHRDGKDRGTGCASAAATPGWDQPAFGDGTTLTRMRTHRGLGSVAVEGLLRRRGAAGLHHAYGATARPLGLGRPEPPSRR